MKRKIFSKILTMLMAFVLVFSITACKGGDGLDLGDWRDLTVRDATGANGVVAAANSYASKAGIDILHAGGNAFDAAAAVGFAIGVVEPNASGIGGGGLMVAYEAKTGKNHFYDFREVAPGALTPENFFKITDAQEEAGEINDKLLTSGVPTLTAGLLGIVEDLGSGKVTRQQILAPAIDYAKNGFTIDRELASALSSSKVSGSRAMPEAFNIYTDLVASLGIGDTLVQENYGKSLQAIADNGLDGFYKGWVADAIIAIHAENEGVLVQEDLDFVAQNFPRKSVPLKTTYNGYDILTVDLPSSGGITVIEGLNMLEYQGNKEKKLSTYNPYDTEYLHIVSTALQLAFGDRRAFVGDYGISPLTGEPFFKFNYINNNGNPLPALTNKLFAKERWEGTTRTNYDGTATRPDQKYDPNSTIVTTGIGPGNADPGSATYDLINKYLPQTVTTSAVVATDTDDGGESSSTTTYSIADKEGNIVSITQTINKFWGEGFMPEGTGFMLNNNCNGFSTTSTSHVLPAGYRQSIASMAPTLVLKDGKPFATYGTPGAERIASTVLQMTLYLIDHGMGMQEAIEMGRIFNYAGSNITVEGVNKKIIEVENLIGQTAINGLRDIGYYVKEYNGKNIYFGGVQGIKFNYDSSGRLVDMTGGADPRRDGKALAY